MAYDPRAHGAKCDVCPLKGCKVVPPEWGQNLVPGSGSLGSAIAIIGEAPGEEEERSGRPFTGRTGEELDRTMHLAGVRRRDVLISNALLCRPPKNKLKDMLTLITKDNKQKDKNYKEACEIAQKEGLEPPPRPDFVPSPIDCCRPRLLGEIEQFQNFITLGGTATKAISGSDASIMTIRGGLMELVNPTRKVMPTLHPSFVIRQPRYIHVMRNDFFKGIRWFRGIAQWKPPELVWHPTPDQIREFLNERKGRILAYDLETNGIEPLTAKIRCLAIGDANTALAIGVLSKDGITHFYDHNTELEVIALLKEYFEDPKEMKYGWNCLYAGTPVILGDGSSRPIESLIREKYKGTVLGLDETTGEMVETPVLNWFKHREPGQKWIVIRRVGEKGHSRGLTLTPDHKVYTQRGWVRADEVVVGDYLHDKERLLYPDERAVLLGTLLGDSCALSMTSKSGADKSAISVQESISQRPTARLEGCHTNPELSQQKVDWLGGFLNTAKPTANDNGYKPGTVAYPYSTSQCRQVGELAKKVYRDSRKRGFTVDVLEELGPEGMAWLYADDGFKGKGDLPGRRNSVRIATCGFTQEDLEVAKDWFSQRFGPVVVTKTKCLSFSIEATYNFCLYISPYLLPAARYKLPPPGPYGLNDWPEFVGAPKRRKCPLPVRVESVSPWTPPDEHSLSKRETRWCITTGTGNFFTGFGLVKNCTTYDATVLRHQWGVEVKNQLDGILLHKSAESEMPHGLGYVGSLYTEVPAWKCDRETGNKLAFGAETDEELLRYCCTDISVTYEVLAPLMSQVKLRDQMAVFRQDTKVQEVCAAMHEVGMHVDQNKRLAVEKKMIKRRQGLLQQIREGLGSGKFNPGSTHQVRDLLFEKWKIEIPLHDKDRLTGSGDPSTSDLVLRTVLTDRTVPKEQRELIKLIRYFRKIQKTLGTYVTKLRYTNVEIDSDLNWDDEDEDFADRALREQYGIKKMGIVNPYTDRMHPGYSVVPPVTGRLSSSKPINCFDGLTEILTVDGWVRFDQLEKGAKVAQYWDSGRIDFVVPEAYHEGHFSGKMISFKHQSSDLFMTPNHRIPLRKTSGRLVTVDANELLIHKNGYNTLHAGNLARPTEGVDLTLAEIRFIVAMHADGSFVKVGGKNYGLDVGFTKLRKKERFEEIISKLDGIVCNPSQGERTRYYLPVTERLEYLLSFIQREKRVWGPWLLDMSEEQAAVFEEELWHWDASTELKNQYANVKELNIDWIQLFLCTRGIRTNKAFYTNQQGNSVWLATVRRTDTNAITAKAEVEEVAWSGQVYCVTVPSHGILVRRKGKVTITRQSMNFPKVLRGMITCKPGHVLVGADSEQIEVRVAAAWWGIQKYLLAFAEGKDPHSMSSYMVFGKAFCQAAGVDEKYFLGPGKLVGKDYNENGTFIGKGNSANLRKLGKIVHLSSQYMAGSEQVHKIIQATEVPAKGPDGKDAEDGTTDLPYALMPLSEVRDMHQRWLAGAPEYKAGWERDINKFKKQGYLREPILGRRRDFLDSLHGTADDLAPNEIVNFSVQSASAAIISASMIQIYEQIPKNKWGPGTGIVTQCHDHIVVECPESEAAWVKGVIEEAMNHTHPALPGVKFAATGEVGKSWDKV